MLRAWLAPRQQAWPVLPSERAPVLEHGRGQKRTDQLLQASTIYAYSFPRGLKGGSPRQKNAPIANALTEGRQHHL